MNIDTSPRIYCGTYAKYNNGSIAGKWLDLEDYADKAVFLAACADLHKDEADPEFMFQDMENIPEGMASESHVSEELWDWLALDENDRELLAVYRAEVESDATVDHAREAYAGKYKDEEDWAFEFLHETHPAFYEKKKENEILVQHFDFQAYARDARLNGDYSFVQHDGETWVFNSR